MEHDYIADIAAYTAAYGPGWENETVATFYGMIGQIIKLWKQKAGLWTSQDENEEKAEQDNRKFLTAARFPSIFADPFADDDGLWD